MKNQPARGLWRLCLGVAVAAGLCSEAWASSGGITGQSTAGCTLGGCHGDSPGSFSYTGTVERFSGASWFTSNTTIAPGSAIAVRFFLNYNSGTVATRGGFNMSATSGTLAESDATIQQVGGELTHTTPRTLTGNNIVFDNLTWTAPTAVGSYVIRSCGQPVNFDGTRNGDGPHSCDTLTITANTNPNAVNDSQSAPEDSTGNCFSVLTNDTSGSSGNETGDSISIFSLGTPSQGGSVAIGGGSCTTSQVRYTPASNFAGTETFTYTIQDSIGASDIATVTVTVTAVNDAPVVTASGGTTAFAEGNNMTSTPVVVDASVVVTDVDDTALNTGTVSITANFASDQDVLAFTNNPSTMGNISGTYDGSTGVLSLSSSGGTATLAQWQAALRSVTYTNTSNTPSTASRTLSFAVNDGTNSSTAATKTVSVASVNDTPTISTAGGTTAFTEGNNVSSTPVVVDSGVSLADLDNTTLGSGTVSITGNFASGQDVLAFTNDGSSMGNIAGSYASGSGVLTLSSSGATATLAQWQAALRAVTYTNSSDAPSTASRTVSFAINDGAATSTAATKTVSVASVNDTPAVATSGGSTAFTEGAAVVVDASVTVADVDTTTQASGTVSITANLASAEDVLAFTNDGASMGNIAGSYSSGTGVLTLTSAGATATIAQWQAALRSVTYNNTSASPSTASRTVAFAVNDGNSASTAATKTVTVNSTNNVPALSGLNGDSAVFTEDGAAVFLDAGADAAVTDVDSPDFNTGSLTAAITVNEAASEDVLGLDTSGNVALSAGLTAGSTVSVSGAAIGAIATGGTGAAGQDLVISFNSGATPARITEVVRALSYANTNNATPSTSIRTLSIVLDDGDGGSVSVSATVSVVSTNDVPTVNASAGTTAFSEGDNVTPTPVIVDSGLSLGDLDHTTLSSGAVTIAGNFASGQDVLAFTNNGTTMGNVAGSYDASSGVLTLSSSGATATVVEWQNALRSVTYTNTSNTPNTASRMISFAVHDGTDPSVAATKTVSVASVNDTPTISATGGTTAFTEGNNVSSTPVVVDSGVSLADLDNTTLSSGTVSITGNFASGQDVLAFTNDGSSMGDIAGSYASGSGVLTLSSPGATATLTQWQAALRAVTYTNSSDAPSTASRTVSFAINDGAATSIAATKTVSVASVNDTPVITSSADTSADDGVAYTYQVVVADSDDTSFTFGLGGEPSGMTISGTGLVAWTPPCSSTLSGYAVGPITVSVNDGDVTVIESYSITVSAPDADGDQMPNCYELAEGFNPNDAADAGADRDGDGRSNLAEFQGGFDPDVDDVMPVVDAPGDIVVPATGFLTAVDLESAEAAKATDVLDGVLITLPDQAGPFRPGRYTITWTATDSAGNTGTATQRLDVVPLADFGVNQVSGEGVTVNVDVSLNGDAPEYPVTITYTVGGSAGAGDSTAASGSVTIASGTTATIPVSIVSDGATEAMESIVFTLGDISGAAAGVRRSHTITIVDQNVAPAISVAVEQGGEPRTTVFMDGGMVTVSALVADPNPGDSATFDWSASEATLLPPSGSTPSFTFEPALLGIGPYIIRLTVTDGAGAATMMNWLVLVEDSLPTLAAGDDTDSDGLDDVTEGFADLDSDGVPDYRDAYTDTAVLQNQTGDPATSELIESEPGVALRMGPTALAAGRTGALIGEDDLGDFGVGGGGLSNGADLYTNVGGLFDFEVSGLPLRGTVRVVLPLQSAIRTGAVYRKYSPMAGWRNFVLDANNAIASAPSTDGLCPGPSSSTYVSGLNVFHDCVRLTLEDGGPNDADGLANGLIRDPGGVGVLPAVTAEDEDGGGGGAVPAGWLILFALLRMISRRPQPAKAKACG